MIVMGLLAILIGAAFIVWACSKVLGWWLSLGILVGAILVATFLLGGGIVFLRGLA